jgi:hypothetical protein
MAFVSVTRLHLRSKRFLLPFLFYTLRSALQTRRSGGFRRGALGSDPQGGNWTVTAWDSDADLRNYRNSGAHRLAMQKLLHWCDEASFAHMAIDDATLPSVEAAYELLRRGRISKVNHPSAAQAMGRTVSDGLPRFNITLRPR